MTKYSSTLRARALFSTHGSPLSENKAGFMAAGKGGKHNKARCSLEFNVLGQKTEYRYQRLGPSGEKSCPRNVENRSTGHTQQVIYSVFSFSLNWEHPPRYWMQQGGKKTTTKEQFMCALRADSRCVNKSTEHKMKQKHSDPNYEVF